MVGPQDVVGVVGFEPTISCSQSTCDNQASLHPADFVLRNHPCFLNLHVGR